MCAIGIVVMSIMVFTQGYLSGALSQTDAVLAGRQAEYLADAIAEALLRVQESRNTEFVGLFQGGSSMAVDPDLTSSLALPGMSVDTVVFSLNDSQDFHGDGRGFYGTVSIEATVGVPRRVARAAGISTYRTVRHDFEYKGVLQGPPADYADKMLFAREMRGLPEMKTCRTRGRRSGSIPRRRSRKTLRRSSIPSPTSGSWPATPPTCSSACSTGRGRSMASGSAGTPRSSTTSPTYA